MIKTKICSYTFILELIKSRSICYKNSYSVLEIIFFSKILKNATNIIAIENLGNI